MLIFSYLLLMACDQKSKKLDEGLSVTSDNKPMDNSNPLLNPYGNTIGTRISSPTSYTRVSLEPNTFEEHLRNLAMKPHNSIVRFFDGQEKANRNVYCAVVDLDIGDKDLHQCADAIMRLKAEHHWKQREYDKIHFNFTNGFRVDYTEWMKGRRMIVNGNKTSWDNGTTASNTYHDFWSYMELIFMYAGTASLEKELIGLDNKEPQIGNVLIEGGHPGHAVVIVDKAKHKETGKPIYLLAQSYMPAQEIQILINPTNAELSPWFDLSTENIETPEWGFTKDEIMRFSD